MHMLFVLITVVGVGIVVVELVKEVEKPSWRTLTVWGVVAVIGLSGLYYTLIS